jgi:hypothetical protein
MRKSGFIVASLLLATVGLPAHGQSIAERLKKALKVTVGKPDSAPKSDSASRRQVDQVSAASPESDPASWPLVPDILGIRIGMSLSETRTILAARSLPRYFEYKTRLPKPADQTEFVSVIVSYTPGDSRNPYAGGEYIAVYFTPLPGPGRVLEVTRAVSFAPERIPRDVDFSQTVTKKYGNRSGEDPLTRVTVWLYPNTGTPTANEQQANVFRCRRWAVHTMAAEWGESSGSRPVSSVVRGGTPTTPRDCGDQLVLLETNVVNRLVPPDERLLTRYTLQLTGTALAFSSQQATTAFIAAAETEVAKTKLERAKAQAKADTLEF